MARCGSAVVPCCRLACQQLVVVKKFESVINAIADGLERNQRSDRLILYLMPASLRFMKSRWEAKRVRTATKLESGLLLLKSLRWLVWPADYDTGK